MNRRDHWNAARFVPGSKAGHYESWFQRANHPERPLAFWIRYTVFSPKGAPQDAIGELWAIWFDGEQGQVTAAKSEFPIQQCTFSKEGLNARIDDAVLDDRGLTGQARTGDDRIAWALDYSGEAEPLLTLPEAFYERGLPKAKGLVGTPLATYNGWIEVNGGRHEIGAWPGSQNHNWGSKHTDQYAWGQVAGFDGHPDSFLECITARVKLGPLWSPWLTLAVLRHAGREYRFNQLGQAFRADGAYGGWNEDVFQWRFATGDSKNRLEARITSGKQNFVGLTYYNPPGGSKTCLNSKLAGCKLTFTNRDGKSETLSTDHRAAFEIITERADHGVPVRA